MRWAVPFYPFFWRISETVERKEDFEEITLVCRDLTAFTAFCNFVSSTMDVYKAISTHRDGGGAKMTSHRRGCG